MADELWSGPVTPLTYALLAPVMVDRMVRRPLLTAGLPELAGVPVFRHHASHVYVNAALLAEVISLIPSPLRSDGLLALLPESARARIRPRSLAAGLAGTGSIVGRLLLREDAWLPWRRAAAFDAACAGVRQRFTAPTTALPATLADTVAALRAVLDDLGDYLAVVSWGMVFAYVFFHLLGEVVGRLAPDAVAAVPELTVGLPGIASLDAHRELVALGAALAARPAVPATLGRDGAARAWVRLRADEPDLATALEAFLARHGHRLIGRDLASPTWREDPARVLALAVQCASDAPGGDAAARRRRATARVDAACGSGPAGTLRRAAIQAVLREAQCSYAIRENMRYHADFFLGRLRALAVHAGALLVCDGALAAVDDVFQLDLDELAGAGVRPDATALAARRAAFVRDAATTPPETLGIDDRTADGAPAPPSVLRGVGGAPGRVRGRVRLIHGPDDFDACERGEIVVASYTDPTWTPILEIATGLVLEAGGTLSHGAIVARELGIPAVVNVTGALRALRTGDIVDVDGTAGTLTVVARRAP